MEPVRRHLRRSRSKLPRPLRKLNKQIGRHVKWRVVFITLLTAVSVVLVAGMALAANANNQVQYSVASLTRIVSTLSNRPGTEWTMLDFNRLQTSVEEVRRSFAVAQRQTFFLRPIASLNADVGASMASLEAAEQLADAASDMLIGLQPTIFFLVSGDNEETLTAQISSGERVVELLRIGRGRFIRAGETLDAALANIEAINTDGLSPDLLMNVNGLLNYHAQLEDINEILISAPDLLTRALGLSDTQSYLVLVQNSDELRPSGGYISTYGWMTVRAARVAEYDYAPTTPTSPNPPPAEMASQFDAPDWWIQYQNPIYTAWDSSWYADFPHTAQMAAWFYDNGNNPASPVDGVISIDITGFEYLLGALGSVEVPNYNVIVTPDNFREVVYTIRASGEGQLLHKRFLAAMYRQIFSDWQSIDRDQQRSTELLGATLRALQERHIMMYFADEDLNRAVSLLGWSGTQAPATDHDYLMVADANLGNKSNHSVIRQLTYDVVINDDGSLDGRTSIAYDFPAYLADVDPAVDPANHGPLDYRSIMQVFLPAGATVTGTNNFFREPTVVPQDTHTIVTTPFEITYDGAERFQISYQTPPLIEAVGAFQRYHLLLQKQPGMRAEVVNVQVTLPIGAQIISATPEPITIYSIDQPILEFRVDLLTDEWIEIIYS